MNPQRKAAFWFATVILGLVALAVLLYVLVLLPADRVSQQSAACGFRLIDWGGAQLQGIPFWDLAQLGESLSLPAFWARREVRRHASLLGCQAEDAMSYLALGIADLGTRLEHMPVELYLEGGERLHRFLRNSVASG